MSSILNWSSSRTAAISSPSQLGPRSGSRRRRFRIGSQAIGNNSRTGNPARRSGIGDDQGHCGYRKGARTMTNHWTAAERALSAAVVPVGIGGLAAVVVALRCNSGMLRTVCSGDGWSMNYHRHHHDGGKTLHPLDPLGSHHCHAQIIA